MSEWIKRSERMPLEVPPQGTYAEIEVLVTNGAYVAATSCQSGCPLTDLGYEPWVEFTNYGPIPPQDITHWMPLPEPPTS